MSILWIAISELPEELKDGREVLLWDGDSADVCTWTVRNWDGEQSWIDTGVGGPITDVTHYCEINAPCEQ